MKKWIVILGLTLALTGCQSADDMKNEAYKEYKLQSHTGEYFTQDTSFWEELETIRKSNNENDIWFNSRSWQEDNVIALGVKVLDGAMNIDLVNDGQVVEEFVSYNDKTYKSDRPEISERLIEALSNRLGERFDNFLEEMKNEKDGCLKEKVIDGTGIIFQKVGEQLSLYVVQSSIQMKEEADNNWLKEICSDNLVVSTATVGEEKQLIELSYPSFVIRNNFASLTNATAYYQLFRTNEGQLEKTRMVINQYLYDGAYENGDLDPEKLEPLQRIVNELAGAEQDITDLINAIYKVVDEKSTKESGKLGTLHYEINRRNAEVGYEKLIEVEITP